MTPDGLVLIGGDSVGSFKIDEDDRIIINFNKGSATTKETIAFAAENGVDFSLMLTPDFEEA